MKLRYANLWEMFLPPDLRLAILRNIGALIGVCLLGIALGFGLSLASWSSDDPSFNQATSSPVNNWLGQMGANVADMAMQAFGLGAIAIAIVAAAWGWRLTSGQPLRRPLRRLVVSIIAVFLAGGFASGLAAPLSWPLVSGLGGMFGDMAFAIANWPFRAFNIAQTSTPATLSLAVFALSAAWYASAIGTEKSLPPPRKRAHRGSKSAADTDDELYETTIVDAGVNALGTASVYGLSATGRLLNRALSLLTGRRHTAEESRLQIAMARAESNADETLDWQPTAPADGGAQIHQEDEVYIDDEDEISGWSEETAPEPHRRGFSGLAGFAMPTLRRLWGQESADQPATGDRIEPQLGGQAAGHSGGKGGGQGFPDPRAQRTSDPNIEDHYDPDAHEFDPDADPELADHDPHVEGQGMTATSRAATNKPKRKRQKSNTGFNHGPNAGGDFQLPPLTLLGKPPATNSAHKMTKEMLADNAEMLEGVLEDFGVRGEIINVRPGPVVTLYELEPAPGIKSSRVIGLADDIARSMSAISARVAVVPGRNAIGIELPNERRETVFFYDLIASQDYKETKQSLPMALGKSIGGEPMVTDLARMPHLLVAGTTGSGKSVGINAMILSLLFRLRPDQCKLIMIDPKMLELSVYDGIPHLLTPVVTEPGKAVVALKWAVREMEDRYKKMSKLGVRNIDGFNKRVREAEAKGEVLSRTVQTGFEKETGQAIYETEEMDLSPLPYIVIVVDEMADLMMVAGKDIEGTIQRLAQMARAAGLHIIMATQRPSVDVITGTIKANFPTRISFQVTSKIDSRTILGEMGAEQLLGQGDMLHMAGGGRIGRVHGAFVSDEEVESVVQFLKRQGVPEYLDAVTADVESATDGGGYDATGGGGGNSGSEADQNYDKAVAIVARDRKASTSYIQRRLSIGYNRAATIIERMEEEGVISAANHAGKREVLAPEPSFDDG